MVQWPKPDCHKRFSKSWDLLTFTNALLEASALCCPSPCSHLFADPIPMVPSELRRPSISSKKCFTAAPILTVPDSSRKFMVEVDDSNNGVLYTKPGPLHLNETFGFKCILALHQENNPVNCTTYSDIYPVSPTNVRPPILKPHPGDYTCLQIYSGPINFGTINKE